MITKRITNCVTLEKWRIPNVHYTIRIIMTFTITDVSVDKETIFKKRKTNTLIRVLRNINNKWDLVEYQNLLLRFD